jgi:hypothetical protein
MVYRDLVFLAMVPTNGIYMNMSIKISPDAEGYTGRECPACEKYFKIRFGTGLPGDVDCHCPYCNEIASHDRFWTKQQIEYARSVAMNQITAQFLGQLKKVERKPDRNQFISIGITVTGSPTPIIRYMENELEEKVTCENCTLEYTIYGVFGYCPDCGVHNSNQMANANYDLILKMLDLASKADGDVANKLIENALEDAISAFDGFGREHCSEIYKGISFQNITRARDRILKEQNLDISDGTPPEEWTFVATQFQKRHLLAHKMGIIDEDYCRNTGTDTYWVGRKVPISKEDVERLIGHLTNIGGNIFSGVTKT